MPAVQTVLVTGATGRVGGAVVDQLAGSGVVVRALTRDPATADLPDGVAVVAGDLTDPGTLEAAAAGVDAVFLVFPSVVADAAAREAVAVLTRHARRIVYLSAHGVPERPDPSAEPDGSIMGSHAHLEGLLAASGAEHVFLRASGFAANTLGWAPQLRESDVLRWFLPDATRALVHEADLAAVGVRALLAEGELSAAYHLTGPDQQSQVEQLAALGTALGRSLRFEELPADEVGAELFPGAPVEIVDSILTGQGQFVAHPEPVTGEVERLTGRPARTYAQWAHDHRADFG